MAEEGAEAGNERGARAKACAMSTAAVPFSASSRSVAAARSLRPVRSTLVAPILPEPMARTSPRPARRVRIRPKGSSRAGSRTSATRSVPAKLQFISEFAPPFSRNLSGAATAAMGLPTEVGSKLRAKPTPLALHPIDLRNTQITKLRISEMLESILLRVRRAAQLTLPADVRRALNVKEGDYLEAKITKGGVLLKPVAIVERDKAWRRIARALSQVEDLEPESSRR